MWIGGKQLSHTCRTQVTPATRIALAPGKAASTEIKAPRAPIPGKLPHLSHSGGGSWPAHGWAAFFALRMDYKLAGPTFQGHLPKAQAGFANRTRLQADYLVAREERRALDEHSRDQEEKDHRLPIACPFVQYPSSLNLSNRALGFIYCIYTLPFCQSG